MRVIGILTCCVFVFLISEMGIAQISLCGIVQDELTGERIILGNVVLYREGVFLFGLETDFEGNYEFRDLESGTYEVEVSYVGYSTKRTKVILLEDDQYVSLDVKITDGIISMHTHCWYGPPMIKFDAFTQGHTLTLRESGAIRTSSMIIRD